MAVKLTPQNLFYNDAVALRIALYMSFGDWLNFRRVCRQWYNDLNQPFLLKDPFVRAKESLFKKLKNCPGVILGKDKDLEELILSAQGNWKDLYKNLSMPKLKAIICMIDAFLPMPWNNAWYFDEMIKFWTTLEYPKDLALLLAASAGHMEIVKGLVIYMPAKEPLNSNIWTALDWAANGGHLETVQVLLDRIPQRALRASFNCQSTGTYALNSAARNGHLKTVQALVNRLPQEALVAQEKWSIRTALHWAAEGGHLETVQLLVDRMPQEALMAQDRWQRTALHCAVDNGHLETVQVLVDRMPQEALMAIDKLERTSLHLAAERGHLEIVQVLVARMPQKALSIQEKYQKTALELAQDEGRSSVVDFLSTRQ